MGERSSLRLAAERANRTNVALLHAGQSTDPDLTLRVTVYSGDAANPRNSLPDLTLKAKFRQINNVLVSNGLNVSQGFVKVERVGTAVAPYYAYAVINDQATSDGSFILPSYYNSQFAVSRFTLPVAVEVGGFRTEVILTNATTIQRNVSLTSWPMPFKARITLPPIPFNFSRQSNG